MAGTDVALTNAGVAVITNRIIQGGTAAKYFGWGTGINTTLTAPISSTGTSLPVASIAGFANGQAINIMLTNGTVFETTISAPPSGSTIVIAAGLSSGASAGAQVWIRAAITDTALQNEAVPTAGGGRQAATESRQTITVANDTYQLQGVITATAGPLAIWEVGSFDAATAGNLILHATFLPSTVNINDSVQFTLSIQFQAGTSIA
jgi:hypothetical protein